MLTDVLQRGHDEFAIVNSVSIMNDEAVLISKTEEDFVCLVKEAGVMGVLGNACSRSVAGLSWVEEYCYILC